MPDGTRQMFEARVNIGRTIQLNSDNTLREPPQIDPSKPQRYDSVKGHTGGSDVYMVYANRKAYPEYLITYKETK